MSSPYALPSEAGLPGGTAVSRLWVYDWIGVDGQAGGSPHVHTASAEAYVVIAGSGGVETLSRHGFAVTELVPGSLVSFTPGTVHRLINSSGDLELLVVMQNAGLPEAGDAVLTFPAPVLADEAEYRRQAALGPNDPMEAARRRKDMAVEGYLELRERVTTEGPQALSGLYAAAARLVGGRVGEWERLVSAGPARQVDHTRQRLDALASLDPGELAAASVTTSVPQWRLGMCGRLQVWPDRTVSRRLLDHGPVAC